MVMDNELKKTLFQALVNGNELEIRKIITKNNIDINEKDGSGNSLLHNAILIGTESSVKAILDLKADPRITNNEGLTPLKLAQAIGGDIAEFTSHYLDEKLRTELVRTEPEAKFARHLIAGGANPFSEDLQGNSAFDLVAEQPKKARLLTSSLEKLSLATSAERVDSPTSVTNPMLKPSRSS